MINCFLAVFKFEGKRLLDRKPLIILLMLLVFVLGFFLYNLSEYKGTQEQKRIFQDFEKKKVEQYLNYRYYGARGFRIFFHHDPISIFFSNSVPIPDMNAFADNTEQLDFYRSINIKTLFELRKNWFTDYSGILFIIGTLLILFYGYQALKSSENHRLPSSITGHKNFFWAVFFARGLWLLLFLIVFLACLILLAAIFGIMIAIDQYLLIFLLVSYGLIMTTFSVGFFCGTLKSAATGIAVALIIWMVLTFFIPTVHNIVIAGNANTMIPAYQFEMDKLIIYMDWERTMREKEGTVKPGEKPSESFKKRMLEYKENELKKLQDMEEEQIAQLKRTKKFYQFLASFFPTTFYQSVNNEISSRGYENQVDFCKYALGEKLKFIGIVIEKEYFSNYSKVEQFNAGNANVYKATPKLPEFFLLGILFNLLWIAAFVIPAYYGYKKRLAELPEHKKTAKTLQDVELQRGTFKSWRVIGGLFYLQMYNLLSGNIAEFMKKRYTFQVSLDGQVLNTAAKKQNFIALSHPSEMPENLKVNAYTRLIMDLSGVDKEKRKEIEARFSLASFRGKRFNQLDMDELGQVFLAILDMKPFDIYLLNDVSRDMSFEFCLALKKKMDELKDSGSLVLFLYSSTDNLLTRSANSTKYFVESNHWYNMVESSKDLKDDETDGH